MTIRSTPTAGSLPLAFVLIAAAVPAYAAGDAAQGQKIFQAQCSACHSTTPGVALFGPSLADVYGKPAASMKDYSYSPALMNAHLTWDSATLDKFLTAPQTAVPGTKMPFAGLSDSTQRADVIAYLAELTEGQK